MNRRTFVQRVAGGAVALGVLRPLAACRRAPSGPAATPATAATGSAAIPPGDAAFAAIRDRYFVRTLELNPVVSTYLGGDATSPTLAGVNGRLRDLSPAAVRAEIDFLGGVARELDRLDPAGLSPDAQIDRALVQAQAAYLIRQLADRAVHQRCIDHYVADPFRGIDWQIQQMSAAERGAAGTEPEWNDVIARVRAVPAYVATARANLLAGKSAGNLPDRRMVERDGVAGAAAAADFFRTGLPAMARRLVGDRRFGRAALSSLAEAGGAAADAYAGFGEFLRATYDPRERTDRFAAGEAEYEWRVRQCLRDPRSAAALYAYGAEQVAAHEDAMVRVAGELARAARLPVRTSTEAERRAAVRAVMDHLNKDAPRSDAQLFDWYRAAAARAVAYGREQHLFDIPADYRLDITETPAVIRSSSGASYYPAPVFKHSGVGRFYLTPTGNDPAQLAQQCRASVADTAVHEGFPGHDWNYKFMTQHAAEIGNVRWLTPGAVEDSFSMWQDSMATEGWGLYAEELMADPAPGRPYGFYSAAEYLYVLQGLLLRAVRVRVDVGIHTGRMSYDEAVDYHAEHSSFYPRARARASSDPVARAVFDEANGAIYRYSKWPTQAITYNLGKNAIIDLRAAAGATSPASPARRPFHEQFMRMGPLPPAYFRDLLLRRLRS